MSKPIFDKSLLPFSKYEGAGNDFVLIDDRALSFDPYLVPKICHRKFGVGADGVILLQPDPSADFRMRIFNSNGAEAESCGNGLRCLLRFVIDLGMPKQTYRIATQDRVVRGGFQEERIWIQLGEVSEIRRMHLEEEVVYFLNTGVPHAVVFSKADFWALAPQLRHHSAFQPAGANVNIARLEEDGSIRVRTYERGVEGETMACGTGAAAVAMIASLKDQIANPVRIRFAGGEIDVWVEGSSLTVIGDARKVYEGCFPTAP